MAKCYQLPCEKCDNVLEVEGKQAGGTLQCPHCEASVEVPTLRGLKTLASCNVNTSRIHAAGGEVNRIQG